MARPPRPSDRRGDGRDRASSRRPGEASGPLRRRGTGRTGSGRPGTGTGRAGFGRPGSGMGRSGTSTGRTGATGTPDGVAGDGSDPQSGSARRGGPRRTPSRERDRPVPPSARTGTGSRSGNRGGSSRTGTRSGSSRSGKVGTTAHPEAHRLTTRTDLSSTVLGPKNYTPRRIGLLAVVAIILLVTVSFPLRNHYEFLRDEKAVAQERAALEATIRQLESEKQLLEDPAFIEQQARIRFGAVKPGETPYRVSTVDPVEEAAAEQRAAEIAALPWQTRMWNSISVPADPVFPENARVTEESLLDGTLNSGIPDEPGAPADQAVPADQADPGAASAPQQSQEDPPA